METTRLDLSYRPLRIAWAVEAGDFAGLRRAVRFSHALWGGQFNPIVVVDRMAEARQLMEQFRPDMIWPASSGETAKKFGEAFPNLITPFMGTELIGPEGTTQVLDVHNALAFLRDKPDGKALRDRGVTLFDWHAEDALADVLLMQLGDYPAPAEIKVDYRRMLTEGLGANTEGVARDGVIPASAIDRANVAVISRFGVTSRRDHRTGFHPGFFIGDAGNFDDLVGFWNIRAADIPLWFVDQKAIARFEHVIAAWEKRATEMLAQRRNAWDRQLAVWSRADVEADARLLGERAWLRIPITDFAWNGLNITVPAMQLGETTVLGVVGDSGGKPRISFAYGEKAFADDVWFYQQHLVVSISRAGGLAHNAEYTLSPPFVPELNEFYARQMTLEYDKLRSEPEGVGLVIDACDHDGLLSALPFSDLVAELFKLAGYEAKLSSGGLIARQLINRLGGLQGGRVFKIPGARRLVKAHGPNHSFTRRTALQMIGAQDPESPKSKFSDYADLYIEQRARGLKLSPADVFGYMLEKGLFRMGADVRCPSCQMAGWVSLDQLRQRIACDLCGHEHEVPRQLAEAEWAFRRSGILGAERNAQGAIPVVLAFQQLDTTFHGRSGRTIHSPSLDLVPLAGKPGTACEVDLVWIMAMPRWQSPRTIVVLGECKDQGSIDEPTMEHLREVADAFPRDRFEVFILLAKIADFSADEIARAKALNRGGINRVIMLTARELEPYFIFERTKKECIFTERGHDPKGLASTTAQIYFREAGPAQPPA